MTRGAIIQSCEPASPRVPNVVDLPTADAIESAANEAQRSSPDRASRRVHDMLKKLAVVAGITFAVGAAALAATHLGDGDDTGFVPSGPNAKAILKCEAGVSKAAGKYGAAIVTCHNKAASAGLKTLTPADDTACESTALGKYNASVAKLTGCPPCLDPAAIAANAKSQLDTAANALFFCDKTSGIALSDGDDSGFVPASKTTAKCLEGAIVTCHAKSAGAQLAAKSFDEEGCETTAEGKFNTAIGKLTGCPTCLSGLLPTLPGLVEGGVDASSGPTDCASPSGAFID